MFELIGMNAAGDRVAHGEFDTLLEALESGGSHLAAQTAEMTSYMVNHVGENGPLMVAYADDQPESSGAAFNSIDAAFTEV